MKFPPKAAMFSVATCAFVTFAAAAQGDASNGIRPPTSGEIIFGMRASLHYAKSQSRLAAEDSDLQGAHMRMRRALNCLVQLPSQISPCYGNPSAAAAITQLGQIGHPIDRAEVDKLKVAVKQLQHGLHQSDLAAAKHDAAAASTTIAGVKFS